jgi:hypothetical protein
MPRTLSPEAAQILMEMGASLTNPAPAIAERILNARHFKAFLLATPRPMRKKAYDALRPYLKFEVPAYSLLGIDAKRSRKVKITRPHA